MKIKVESACYQIRKTSELPKEINLNKEVSWMIGFWVGDNWGSREGSVTRNNIKTSGRFGIISNDEEVIMRFLRGLKKEFKITNIKIDVQIPQHQNMDKEVIKKEISRKFHIELKNINMYKGSPWRKKVGLAVYTNNTALLRFINTEIFNKLFEYIQKNNICINMFLQGIADSEGSVNKANKCVRITNKDAYIVKLIVACLEKLRIHYTKKIDKRQRIIIEIRDLEGFNKKVGFWIKRKQQALEELLAGNFLREKDRIYLKLFRRILRKGIKARELSKKTNLPYSTIKMVLRSLASAGLVKRKKLGTSYIYYIP